MDASSLTQTAIPLIEHFSTYAALIAFAAAFGETLIGLGMLLPGSTILLVMGVLAGQGYLNIMTVMLFGILGAWLGDSTNYHLGKKYGTVLFRKPWLHIPESAIEKAHDFLDSHGAKSVFFSRFLPGLKETVPFLAGSARMDRRKFLLWNLFGAVGWGLEFIGTGYLFSSSLALAQAWVSRSAIVLGILVGVGLILWILKRFLQANIPAILSILGGMKQGVLHSRPVLRFAARHPRWVAWVSRRFDRSRFTGLPLTILGLSFGYVLLLFGGIIEDFLTKDSIIYVDHITANLMAQWRTPDLTQWLTWLTYLGREWVVVALIVTVAIILAIRRERDALIAFGLTEAGTLLFLYLSKLGFHRPRPDIALYFESTYSFPSGHATFAVALYGFIGYLLMRHAGSLRARLNIFFVTTVLVLVIGLSRVYLGEHYLSDVYAGFLLGTLWVIVGITVLKWRTARRHTPAPAPMRYHRLITGALLMLLVANFAGYNATHPYPPAQHAAPAPLVIKNLKPYFSEEDNRFTRNLLGIPSRPITVILSSETDPCHALTEHGWHPIRRSELLEPPLFYHAAKPLCRLAQHTGTQTRLLSIWHPDIRYRGHRLYLGAADAIIGKQWGTIPRYLPDTTEARHQATEAIIKALPEAQTTILSLDPPAIRRHLNGHDYLDDGKAVWIEGK